MKIKIIKTINESNDPFAAAMRHLGGDEGLSDPDLSDDGSVDATMPLAGSEGAPKTAGQLAREKAEELGFKLVKPLGEGKYGKVYLISKPNHNLALKVVSHMAQREVENYETVSNARSQSENIAKHFPKVFHTSLDGDNGFIVMELLTDSGVESMVISDLVGDGEMIVPLEQDQPYKNLRKRMYMYLRNTSVRRRLLSNMFSLTFANDDVRDKIGDALEYRLGPDFGVEFLKSRSIAGKFNQIKQLEDKASSLLDSNTLSYVFDRSGSLKDEFIANPGALTFLLIALETAKEADPYAGTYQSWYERTVVDATNQFMSFYRRATPVPYHYGEQRPQYAGAMPQDADVYSDATSLRTAMQELVEITGLFARDVHGGNVMVRPETGDLVIVDLGLFKKRKEMTYEEKKRTRKKTKGSKPVKYLRLFTKKRS